MKMAKRPPAPEKPPEYEEVSEIYVDKGLFTGKRAVSFAGWFCEGDNFHLCAACDLLPVQIKLRTGWNDALRYTKRNWQM